MPRRVTKSRRSQSKGVAPFRLGGWTVEPGTSRLIEIRLGELYDQAPIGLRTVVLHGRRPGPRLWVSGGVHGDELVGIIAVHQLLEQIDVGALAGTLVAIPCVNQIGALHCSRELPDGRDLNRSFPGSRTGTLASRIARAFLREVAARCTHGIDLHTAGGHRDNLPQVRANLDDPETHRLAALFGAPIILHANLRDGSLRQAASARGVVALLFEGGKALRHEPHVVRSATEGVLRVMAALGMIEPSLPKARAPRVSWASSWVRTPRSGYFVNAVDLGDRVRKGQSVGQVLIRVQSGGIAHRLDVRTPRAGVVIGIQRLPLVHVGDPLIHVADVGRRPGAEKGPRDRGESVVDS